MSKFLIATISTLLIFTGCTPKIYNTPYIDATETVQLEFQLTKDEVINLLGKPLYVESGNKVNDEVFWIYEVRARSVKSDIIGKNIILNKDHNDTKLTSPIHHLRITFIDGKVSKWRALTKDKIKEEEKVDKSENEKEKKIEKSIVEKLKPKFKKKEKTPMKFFFHPKVSYDIIEGYYNEDMYDQHYSSSGFSWGASFGFEKQKYRLGIDAKMGAQFGAMVIFEKRNLYRGINLIAGVGAPNFGAYSHQISLDKKTTGNTGINVHEKDYKSGESYIKMGINKTFVLAGKPVTPSMELVVGSGGLGTFPSFSIAYHLK